MAFVGLFGSCRLSHTHPACESTSNGIASSPTRAIKNGDWPLAKSCLTRLLDQSDFFYHGLSPAVLGLVGVTSLSKTSWKIRRAFGIMTSSVPSDHHHNFLLTTIISVCLNGFVWLDVPRTAFLNWPSSQMQTSIATELFECLWSDSTFSRPSKGCIRRSNLRYL